MCGFAGLATTRGLRYEELIDAVERMNRPIAHRGPDDSGHWADAECGVAFGFRRLAIIDLSSHGHQPMRSSSGRFTIVFNGEIYNHQVLRTELLHHGATFRGHSDTEVILEAFQRWGIPASLARFVGMFAMAIWDAETRTLVLARDRLGKKPLFVLAQPGLIAFGSELKALHASPAFDGTLDRDALAQYLRYLYVPGPGSIFERVRKLEPGHLLALREPFYPLPAATSFWSLDDVVQRETAQPFRGSESGAVDELDDLLRDAVRSRMCADVPLGAFLSGGIDSSTVTALMQAQSDKPIRTFSVGFDVAEHDEARHAAAVAQHLGTEHTEIHLTGRDALDVVPRLATIYDEPFADASQIPTYLVCRESHRHVTVVLSGDGGDEIFGGYNRYVHGQRLVPRIGRMPSAARHLLGRGLTSIGTADWDRAYQAIEPALPRRFRHRLPGNKLHRIGYLMSQRTEGAMYRSLVSAWQNPLAVVREARERADAVESAMRATHTPGLLSRMLFADQSSYLTEDQMTKVDRASMAVSLEVRVPILDHRVVEFAWRLPESLKVRDGSGKWILRQVLYRYVPRPLVEREKMGFSVPLGPWLRGPLRDWAASLLDRRRLASDGILNPSPIERAWRGVIAGHDQAALSIWAVLMFQQWKERWLP